MLGPKVPNSPSEKPQTDGNSEELLALIAKAKDGDERAFEELYKRFVTPIYRFIFFNVRHKLDAEDLTQAVFLRAFKALPKYVERGVPFGAWLYTIARNATIDYWKKRRDVLVDNPEEVFDTVASDERPVDESLNQENRAGYIQSLLGNLSEDQREIVTLFFIQDLSHAEISDLTGKSEEAIRALKHRALKVLRGKVDEKYL